MSGSEARGGWVRFTRAWDWNIPKYGGRATKHFPAGCEIRLTCEQMREAVNAQAVEMIPTPAARYSARRTED